MNMTDTHVQALHLAYKCLSHRQTWSSFNQASVLVLVLVKHGRSPHVLMLFVYKCEHALEHQQYDAVLSAVLRRAQEILIGSCLRQQAQASCINVDLC